MHLLSPLLFNSTLANAIGKVQENQKWHTEWNISAHDLWWQC